MFIKSLRIALYSCLIVAIATFFEAQNSVAQTTKGISAAPLSATEQELLSEINHARAQPKLYATYLENLKPLFSGKVYKPTSGQAFTTEEGWSAVEDAIKFLRALKPLGPFNPSPGLSLAAALHVKEQNTNGSTGHMGANNSMVEQRAKTFGTWQGGIGESLSYGNESARERVLTWLIDDGVATRGHRKRMLSADYKVAGLSCGGHPEYGAMCVLTLAGGFTDLVKPGNAASQKNGASNKKTAQSKSTKAHDR